MVGGFYATVDHLVNNAGVTRLDCFEDFTQFSDIASIMVIIKTIAVPLLFKKIVILNSLEIPKNKNSNVNMERRK